MFNVNFLAWHIFARILGAGGILSMIAWATHLAPGVVKNSSNICSNILVVWTIQDSLLCNLEHNSINQILNSINNSPSSISGGVSNEVTIPRGAK